MNETKKLNIEDIYYATLKNSNDEYEYVILMLENRCWVDIKTDKLYPFSNQKQITESNLHGITPYKLIVKNAFGKKTVGEILNRDKFISKRLNKYSQYTFNDTLETQETLAIIKPDGVPHIDKIINMIYKSGLKIKKYDIRLLDEEILKGHYEHLISKTYYNKLIRYMSSSEVILMVLEGQNAREVLRELMGPTDSLEAPKNTIRGMFGTDKMQNVMESSFDELDARQEISRFFKQQTKIK